MITSRLDPLSQLLLQLFYRKLLFLLMMAGSLSLLDPRHLYLGCMLLQAQALVSSAISMAFGLAARHRFNGETLTYWDEALAFTGIGLLGHFGAGLFAV
ncbi:MAG TPA: hypothetical protein VGF92_21045 [Stellaceae bacterium]|jgi:hypothetical protein